MSPPLHPTMDANFFDDDETGDEDDEDEEVTVIPSRTFDLKRKREDDQGSKENQKKIKNISQSLTNGHDFHSNLGHFGGLSSPSSSSSSLTSSSSSSSSSSSLSSSSSSSSLTPSPSPLSPLSSSSSSSPLPPSPSSSSLSLPLKSFSSLSSDLRQGALGLLELDTTPIIPGLRSWAEGTLRNLAREKSIALLFGNSGEGKSTIANDFFLLTLDSNETYQHTAGKSYVFEAEEDQEVSKALKTDDSSRGWLRAHLKPMGPPSDNVGNLKEAFAFLKGNAGAVRGEKRREVEEKILSIGLLPTGFLGRTTKDNLRVCYGGRFHVQIVNFSHDEIRDKLIAILKSWIKKRKKTKKQKKLILQDHYLLYVPVDRFPEEALEKIAQETKNDDSSLQRQLEELVDKEYPSSLQTSPLVEVFYPDTLPEQKLSIYRDYWRVKEFLSVLTSQNERVIAMRKELVVYVPCGCCDLGNMFDTAGTGTLSVLDNNRQTDAVKKIDTVFYVYKNSIPKSALAWVEKLKEDCHVIMLRNPMIGWGVRGLGDDEEKEWKKTLDKLMTGEKQERDRFEKFAQRKPNFAKTLFGPEAVERAFRPALIEPRREGEGGGNPVPFNDYLDLLSELERGSLQKLKDFLTKGKSLQEFEELRSEQSEVKIPLHELTEGDIDKIQTGFEEKLKEPISFPDRISRETIEELYADYGEETLFGEEDARSFLLEIAREEGFSWNEEVMDFDLGEWRETDFSRDKLMQLIERQEKKGLMFYEREGEGLVCAQNKLFDHFEKMHGELKDFSKVSRRLDDEVSRYIDRHKKSEILTRFITMKRYNDKNGIVNSPSLVDVLFGSSEVLDPLLHDVVKLKVPELFRREKRKLFLYLRRWMESLSSEDQSRVLNKHLDSAISHVFGKKFSVVVEEERLETELRRILPKAIKDDCLGADNYAHKPKGWSPRGEKDQKAHVHHTVVNVGIFDSVQQNVAKVLVECSFVKRFKEWVVNEGLRGVVSQIMDKLRGKHDDVFANDCQKRDELLQQIHHSLLALTEGRVANSALRKDILRRVKWHCALVSGVTAPGDEKATIPLQVLQSWSNLSERSLFGKSDVRLLESPFSSLSARDFSVLFASGTQIKVPAKVRNICGPTSITDPKDPSSLSRALSLSMYGVPDFGEYLELKMDKQNGLNLFAACEAPGYHHTPILLLFDENGDNGNHVDEEMVTMRAILLCPNKEEAKKNRLKEIQHAPQFPILRFCQRKGRREGGEEGVEIWGVLSDGRKPEKVEIPSNSQVSLESIFGDKFVGASQVEIEEQGGGEDDANRLVIAHLVNYVVKSVLKREGPEVGGGGEDEQQPCVIMLHFLNNKHWKSWVEKAKPEFQAYEGKIVFKPVFGENVSCKITIQREREVITFDTASRSWNFWGTTPQALQNPFGFFRQDPCHWETTGLDLDVFIKTQLLPPSSPSPSPSPSSSSSSSSSSSPTPPPPSPSPPTNGELQNNSATVGRRNPRREKSRR